MWPWTPASAQEAGEASPWKVDTFYENATFVREHVGLSKFRNTLQIEADRKLGPSGGFSNGNLHVVLRGTYDGVYRLNSREFGNKAGGAITLQNGVPGLDYSAAFGAPAGALVGTEGVLQGGGLQLFNAANVLANNPNEGMIVLGSRLHDQGGGIAFGVPVRPCDVDSRGCLKGYMDASRRELESPEFNSRIDFIRELAWSGSTPLGDGKELFIKVGKQQIVWGRTDLFRVLDVINPIDYSRQNIFDEAQDIRIPRWIAQGEYRMGATGPLSDLNLQVVWNFDKFRPHNLGQGGSPYSIIDAGSFFRGMKNLWDNGGTVANFAAAGVFGPTPGLATTFGPNQIGIRQADMPRWSLSNTQLGAKLEGVYKSASFSLNALTYRSQLPSLHGGIASVNPFTGVVGNYSFVPAFDIVFPRVNLLGGSMDLPLEDGKSSIRLESTFTRGEEFPNTLQPFGFSKSRVVRYVIGFDRPTFIPFLNAQRTFLLSGQLFGQHLLDHQLDDGPLGKRGIPDWKHNHIATLLFKGFYYNDRLSPQLLMAHDLKAHATVWGPSVEWLVTDSLKVALGANIKTGTGAQQFDDGRTANPFPPFTGPGPVAPSLGLGGFEPLGRFLAGPIGMARNENELQFTLRYKF